MRYISKCEADTIKIAAKIAQSCQKGDVFALYGTLGVGKTAFSKGFIQSLTASLQEVPSPTFTLLQTYETPRFEVYHFDMYRLKSPDEAYELGIEEAFYEGVSLIEWPEKLGNLLPVRHTAIFFDITDENQRTITIEKKG